MSDRSIPDQILDAAQMHVVFDGWSEETLIRAAADAGVDLALARVHFPRGAVDLACAYHRRGDRELRDYLAAADLSHLKIREKITHGLRKRLEIAADKDIIRRGMTLFALPNHMADGARLTWETCDVIWSGIGDTSTDGNWYSKRATLAAVYGATVLYWLGDTSDGDSATWEFLDRRIENVMQFEKAKAQLSQNPLTRPFMAGPNWVLSKLRAPSKVADVPGIRSTGH